jgi:hypothetical protein
MLAGQIHSQVIAFIHYTESPEAVTTGQLRMEWQFYYSIAVVVLRW